MAFSVALPRELAFSVLGARTQKLQIVFKDVLDSKEDVPEACFTHNRSELVTVIRN
jgi:hypothetical protein